MAWKGAPPNLQLASCRARAKRGKSFGKQNAEHENLTGLAFELAFTATSPSGYKDVGKAETEVARFAAALRRLFHMRM